MMTDAMRFPMHALLRADAKARTHNAMIVAVAMTAFAVVLTAALLIPGKTFVTTMPQDVFIFIDGAYRLAHGQVPHADFQTPLGALGFVLPYLCCSCCTSPPIVASRRIQVADGIVAGLLVAFLIYTKITYGLIALSFLGAWFILSRGGRVSACIALGCVVMIGGVVEAAWHLHQAYASDVAFAVRAGQARYNGLLGPFVSGWNQIDELGIAAFAVSAVLYFKELRFRDALFLGFCAVAASCIISQNTYDRSLAGLVVVCAFAAERLERAQAEGRQGALQFGRLAATAMLLLFLAEPFVFRTAALWWHFEEARRAGANSELPAALAGFPAADFRGLKITVAGPTAITSLVEPGLTPERAFLLLRDHSLIYALDPLGSEEYLYTLGKGVEALAGVISGNHRIFVFDFANPFPFLVGTPPIRGDLYSYDLYRQYSRDVHIPTEKLFSTVTLALVPRFPLEYKDRDALWDLYGDYVRQHFVVLADTPYWTVWRRADR